MGDLSHVKCLEATKILDRIGIPWKQSRNCLMTWALWRGDRDPSVRIRQMPATGHWVFTDYGEGNRGGSMVDLLALYTGLSIGEIVTWLEGFADGDPSSLQLLHPLPQSVGFTPSGKRLLGAPSRSGAGIEVVQEWQANRFDNLVLENEL